MKTRLLFLFTFLLITHAVSAQTGNYFLSHYSPSDEKISYPSFDMMQDKSGVIYFASKTGIMKFDGRNWDVISTPGAVYTLSLSEKNIVFAGGLHGFGKIGVNKEGLASFETISTQKDDANNIFSSLVVANRAYFLKDTKLFVVDAENDKIEKVIPSTAQNLFVNLFEVKGNVYVSQEDGTLSQVSAPDKGEVKITKTTLPFAPKEEILFTEKSSEGRYMIVAASGRVWINESSTGARELKLKDSQYLLSNVVINGAWVNDKLIVFGTLRGGILFVDPQTGNTEEITNYFTGLPDNEVVSIMSDRSQGVWVAHEYGFTRVAPYLPFRTFNHYSGIEGNLLCATSFKDQVYVGTTLGLYKLHRQEIYEDEVYYIDKPVKGRRPLLGGGSSSKPVADVTQTDRAKSKRGIFGFLKRDKEEKPAPTANSKTSTNSKTTTPAKTKTSGKKPTQVEQQRMTRKVLKAISYVYKKVEGINGKVSQLIVNEGKLIAAGASGVLKSTSRLQKH